MIRNLFPYKEENAWRATSVERPKKKQKTGDGSAEDTSKKNEKEQVTLMTGAAPLAARLALETTPSGAIDLPNTRWFCKVPIPEALVDKNSFSQEEVQALKAGRGVRQLSSGGMPFTLFKDRLEFEAFPVQNFEDNKDDFLIRTAQTMIDMVIARCSYTQKPEITIEVSGSVEAQKYMASAAYAAARKMGFPDDKITLKMNRTIPREEITDPKEERLKNFIGTVKDKLPDRFVGVPEFREQIVEAPPEAEPQRMVLR